MLPASFEAIAKLSLFRDLDLEKHGDLLDKIQIESFAATAFIFHEGDPKKDLYVIKSGEVEIVRIHDQIAEEVAFLKAGDVFGELGSLGENSRNASARAFTDIEVLIMDQETVVQLAARLPSFDLLVGERFMERRKANENSSGDVETKTSEND